MQFTTAGIHRDDLIFSIDGHPARATASQGQQKSFIVALKLAKFSYQQDERHATTRCWMISLTSLTRAGWRR
ncbi:MAG: hypothetical protein MZV63_11625 [Marinilabiliales bacterium]|nr:hypothetical protein [Marinilabiliales bacterium]